MSWKGEEEQMNELVMKRKNWEGKYITKWKGCDEQNRKESNE